MTHLTDVETFHNRFGIGYAGPPRLPDHALKMFRLRFLAEELTELGDALGVSVTVMFDPKQESLAKPRTQRLASALDALLDLQYVLLGTTILFGLSSVWEEGWRRVHTANIAKVRGEKLGDHKFGMVKPPGWRAPDLTDLVRGTDDSV